MARLCHLVMKSLVILLSSTDIQNIAGRMVRKSCHVGFVCNLYLYIPLNSYKFGLKFESDLGFIDYHVSEILGSSEFEIRSERERSPEQKIIFRR